MKRLLKLTSIILIQAFLLSSVCFAESCLSPQIQLKNPSLFTLYDYSCRREGPNTEIFPNGLNHKYEMLINKLKHQVGTAEELLENIKNKYPKYRDAVIKLEEFEKHRKVQDWVIEHGREVMLMSYYLGKVLGFGEQHLAQIAVAARFHDIGKCQINPEAVNDDRLFSKELFSEGQIKEIRGKIAEHSAESYEILKESGIKDEVILNSVFYHHANVDGSGYPAPVTRQEIPLEAKITRIADSLSAMLGKRPYIPVFKNSFEDALSEIRHNDYHLYGPRVVRTFMKMIEDEKVTNRFQELYFIPLKESKIFRGLFKLAKDISFVYPFAKVGCGVSRKWNEEPYATATNSIGTHRHAEINLILKVLDERLHSLGIYEKYGEKLRRLQFLSYSVKINESEEALKILHELRKVCKEPFKENVLYLTMRPCASCLAICGEVGIKQIYFGSEHPDQGFVNKSEKQAEKLRAQGVKIARAHFVNEGVLEPNSLFFSLCLHPAYEEFTDTVDSWFSGFIDHDDKNKMSISDMEEKQKEFTSLINSLLSGIDKNADLKKFNELIKGEIKLKKYGLTGESLLRQPRRFFVLIRQAI